MRSAALLAVALLAACSGEPGQPGGITPDEAQQLNDAAAMLDNEGIAADALVNEAED